MRVVCWVLAALRLDALGIEVPVAWNVVSVHGIALQTSVFHGSFFKVSKPNGRFLQLTQFLCFTISRSLT